MKIRRKTVIIACAIYFIICIPCSLWNFFYGPLQSSLYNEHATVYDGPIQAILGYTKSENGDYRIYVKGMLKSGNSSAYIVSVPHSSILDPVYTDKGGVKYIHLYKENVFPVSANDFPDRYDDTDTVALYGERHIEILNDQNPPTTIHVVVKHIVEHDTFYTIAKPFAFIIDFLISPFNIGPFVPV